MAKLPNELPRWYTVVKDKKSDEKKGWTPETPDITDKPENTDVVHAWNGEIHSPLPKKVDEYTCRLERLQILSPIQVGGGKFPEGEILPAQIGGVPCIPGSSVRGSLLRWMRKIWEQLPADEKTFWEALMMPDGKSWQPRRIRFESLLLLDSKKGREKEDTLLKPFPLNAQQNWQIFNQKGTALGVQWQIPPSEITPADSRGATKRIPPNRFPLQVGLKGDPTKLPVIHPPTKQQLEWLRSRLTEMLKEQGIGRGTHSGFGRLGEDIPKGMWVLELEGMKPCVQQHSMKDNQKGKYRWSPQVLRANLRGHFMRLALNILPKGEAQKITDKIFGGLKSPAQLTLTSYLKDRIEGKDIPKGYKNIPAQDAHEKWVINVQTDKRFESLIGKLLEFASHIGGLGPGWRRPPHKLERFGGFRGSKFTVQPSQQEIDLPVLIGRILADIKSLAEKYGLQITAPQNAPGIFSIWRGETKQWDKNLVHGVCRTGNPDRPAWCGTSETRPSGYAVRVGDCGRKNFPKDTSETRPSGYAVREHEDHCLVTVFDKAVEATLREHKYERIWNSQTVA
jgi:CRISPR-associated protein Cmr6